MPAIIGGITKFFGTLMIVALCIIAAMMYGGWIAVSVIAGIIGGIYLGIKWARED